MANYNQDWENLGQSIQDIVDRAVNSRDYQKLNQTITQIVDRAVGMGGEAVRKAMDNVNQSPKTNLPVLYGSTGHLKVKGALKTAGGIVLAWASGTVFLLSSLGGLGIMGVLGIAGMAGGAGLIYSGAKDVGMTRRFKTYRQLLGEKTHCTLDRLARGVGKNVKFVRRELRQMIDQGLFIEGHIDSQSACLITSDETYRYFEQSRLQLEERKRQETAEQAQKAASSHSPQVQEILDRGNAYVAQIRKCNDDIPGEEISAKIDRIENIVRRIFRRVETNPEVIPDLKKMMDYYLPMTVKLLTAYADMDAEMVQGEQIQSSKREIEQTLDTLNLAFEKLLDSLFADTAMDISSDISVLNTLLAQEGLTEDDLTKMKKQQKA